MPSIFKRFRGSRQRSKDGVEKPDPAADSADPKKSDSKSPIGDSSIPNGGEAVVDEDLPADVKELPLIVRNTVSLEDDPSLPTITFRYFVLCLIFIPPGAILFQMGAYRTTAAVYPVLFVQIGM